MFEVTSSGALTTLYDFCSQSGCTDGQNPDSALVQAPNGNFYGTTTFGGVNDSCFDAGCGTVFEITPSGTLTTLYSFCSQSGCADGSEPFAGLVQASDGNFYGTTGAGGSNGNGTVFKITPSGTLTTLHTFCLKGGNCTDGSDSVAGLVQGADGNLYGTTLLGGDAEVAQGTVFEITLSGTLTTLYSFCFCTGGANPRGGLVQGTNGNFYGTTDADGADNGGTVFEITPSGTLTTLYNFCSAGRSCTDGSGPQGTLIQDTNGNLYGTTATGGANEDGTVFSLSVGLKQFVEPQTTSGKVGSVVKILGTDLTGATSVSFNGTAAVFKLISPSVISATVPEGATSGKVEVTVSGHTLSSNVPFRVRP